MPWQEWAFLIFEGTALAITAALVVSGLFLSC